MTMDVVGYTDRMSVAPGEEIRIMCSSTDSEVHIDLVRLRHGDERAHGLRTEPVSATLSGTYSSGYQPLRSGSHVVVPHCPELDVDRGFGVDLWVCPTMLAAGRQALIGKRDHTGLGWGLDITEDGKVCLSIRDPGGSPVEVTSERRVRERSWYHIAAAVDRAGCRAELMVRPRDCVPARSRSEITETERVWAPIDSAEPAFAPVALLIAGAWRRDGGDHVAATFNGKIAAPRLHRVVPALEQLADTPGAVGGGDVFAWDFARDPGSTRIPEISGSGVDGTTVHAPTRAVTGPFWDDIGNSTAERRDAVHFHDDDLGDAGWHPTAIWMVDSDLPSGIYAAHVRGRTIGEDYIPLIVRPPRERATAEILVVAPLFSWLAYGNVRALEEYTGAGTEAGAYVVANRLNSLYDLHSDGSGVAYSSWRRPLLNLRPGFRLPILDSPHQLGADLHLVDWLIEFGHDFDVVTDEDLHRDGVDLLRRYPVMLSGTHAEYWSAPMLDALEGYLSQGGRYMYLSGNGMYWATAFDGAHTIEVRRHGAAVSAWHCAPGEGDLATTGEPGGLWRWRGRPPQRYVGVGFSACWATTPEARGSGYRRAIGDDARAAFVFEGVEYDEPIGAFPNLILGYGAAGYEVDRADFTLGTPAHALILATADEFPEEYWTVAPEEVGRSGVRADMVFFETPGGGAVFSVGSIAWCGALSYNDYDNNVSTVTGNVLRRFLDRTDFPMPIIE